MTRRKPPTMLAKDKATYELLKQACFVDKIIWQYSMPERGRWDIQVSEHGAWTLMPAAAVPTFLLDLVVLEVAA